MPSRRRPLPWWVHAADAAALVLLLLGLFVAVHGGFVVWPAGIRVSIRSEWRVIVLAGTLLLLRHVLVREPALHRRIYSGIGAIAAYIGAAARAPGPLLDDGAASSEDPEHGPARRRVLERGLWVVGIVGVFAILTVVMTYPQVRHMTDAISRNYGDPLFSAWRLSWVAHQLPRDPLNLFNANIFYPERGTLLFSDSMLVPALMAAPFLWLGVPSLVVYNVMLLSGFALSGAGMFLLVRSLTGSSGAALLGGFAFAFLPFRDMHYAHLELQITQWMPLCVWALHRTVTRGRIRDGLLTGLFLALQCLSSWYYGIFLATFLVPVGAVCLVGEGASRALASIRALAAGSLLAAVLIVPMALPYLDAREHVGERPESEIRFYSATPQNYLAAHRQNVPFGRRTWHLGGQERELFMGFVVPLLALVGLWPPLSAARIAFALGLVLAFDVSLGFNGMLHPWLHEYVLPYRGLRVPARMAIVVGLALAILAGYGAARILGLMRGRLTRAAVSAVLVLAVWAEYRSVPLLKTVWARPSPIYDALPAPPASVLLELPLLEPDISLEPIYMYFSTFHWNALANGYSGFSPPSYPELRERIKTFPDQESIAELRRRGVTHVVVHGALFSSPETHERIVARMNSCTDLEFVTEVQWQHRGTRLYRLVTTEAAEASGAGHALLQHAGHGELTSDRTCSRGRSRG